MASVDIAMTGRPDLVEMAVGRGYLAGTRLDKVGEHERHGSNLEFIDIHWEDPHPDDLVRACERHSPKYVVAGDYDGSNHDEINARAERFRDIADHVIIVPHHDGDLQHVPEWAVIGYSVPSEYAGTEIPLREYRAADQPIHVLGGTPHEQHRLLGRLWTDNVISMDCNSHHKAATIGSKAWYPVRPHWRQVAPHENRVEQAYRASVENLRSEHHQRGIAQRTR